MKKLDLGADSSKIGTGKNQSFILEFQSLLSFWE